MKIPLTPPNLSLLSLANESLKSEAFSSVTEKGEYIHWDKLRHLQPPLSLSAEQWWGIIKLARKALYKPLPFTDKYEKSFLLASADIVLQKLHTIDRNLGNNQIQNNVLNTHMKETYLVQSLIEEAITSSQLEGASTTRRVAKEMLSTNRKPRNVHEQMIFNNYQAMQFVQTIKNESLTIDIILELHRILTENTLDHPTAAGQLRKSDDIHVFDNRSQEILHTPPKAETLKARLKKLCEFANTNEDEGTIFIHPIIKAILLHFMLAYDHPFVDGNGRTARTLFYWSMANQGYGLAEFISISKIIKRAPSQYARAYLYTETDDNDVTYFILHQLDVIIQAIRALHQHLHAQTKEINEIEKLLYANKTLRDKLNYRQITLIKHALKHPDTEYIIEAHRRSHNITYDTARTDLLNLMKLGLLVKRKVGKAFVFSASGDLKKKIEKTG